jgi:hypothetical protein
MSRGPRGISWELTEARFTRSTMPSASVSISTSTLLFHSSSAASRYSAGVRSVAGSAAPCGSSLAVGSFEGRDTSDWGISDISESFKPPSHARSRGVGSARRQIVIELSARTFISSCSSIAIAIGHIVAIPSPGYPCSPLAVAFVRFPEIHSSEPSWPHSFRHHVLSLLFPISLFSEDSHIWPLCLAKTY